MVLRFSDLPPSGCTGCNASCDTTQGSDPVPLPSRPAQGTPPFVLLVHSLNESRAREGEGRGSSGQRITSLAYMAVIRHGLPSMDQPHISHSF